jgi:hypothetical protein
MQLRDRLCLAPKPQQGSLVGQGAVLEDFQRDRAAERHLLGHVDDAHTAPADLTDDAEIAQRGRLAVRVSNRTMDEINFGQAPLEDLGEIGVSGKKSTSVG